MPGTIVGVFFVAVSVNGLTLAGAADWVDPLFNGTAVVVAVAISTVLAHRRAGAGQLWFLSTLFIRSSLEAGSQPVSKRKPDEVARQRGDRTP